jgi:hypothetical protein
MTNLVTGEAISASTKGLMVSAPAAVASLPTDDRVSLISARPHFVEGSDELIADMEVSTFVAASGAFPGAFPAVEFEAGNGTNLLLADGGIVDNTGIGVMLDANYLARTDPNAKDWELDVILASDGGQLFRPDDKPGLLRFVDVIHATTSSGFAASRSTVDQGLPVVRMSPSNILTLSPVSDLKDPVKLHNLLDIPESLNLGFELYVDWDRIDKNHFQLLSNSLLPRSEILLAEQLQKTSAVRNQMDSGQKLEFEHTIMKAVVNAELKRCIKTFLETSTLKDQMNESEIDDLYRLGQFLVYLRWDDIQAYTNH